MGRGPARPIKISEDGRMGRGPAQPITFSKFHGPARPIIFSEVSARPDNYVGRPVYLTGRPMCCPVLKGACAYVDDVVLSPLLFFRCFSRLDSVGQLLSAQETHNQHPLLTQSCSTYDSVRWLPVDHLLVLLNTRCCCNSRCCSTL